MPRKQTDEELARPKRKYRKPFERERDFVTMADMYCRGATQAEIARHLGLSRESISKDLTALREKWAAANIENLNAYRMEQLAKIDVMEREYWAGYARSIGKKQERKTGTKKGIAETGQECDLTMAEVKKYEEVGDPRFLQGVERCIEMRCKLLGLFAPQKLEHTGADGKPIQTESALSIDERIAKYVAVLQPVPT